MNRTGEVLNPRDWIAGRLVAILYRGRLIFHDPDAYNAGPVSHSTPRQRVRRAAREVLEDAPRSESPPPRWIAGRRERLAVAPFTAVEAGAQPQVKDAATLALERAAERCIEETPVGIGVESAPGRP